MRDVDLIDLLATRIEVGLASAGLLNVPVLKKTMPNQQGMPTGDVVYFQKLFSHVYGSPMYSTIYNQLADNFTERESQLYVTHFQITAIFPEIPGNVEKQTSSDVASYLQRYLASRASLRYYKEKKVAIYRITDVRDPSFNDDQNQFEIYSNFDIQVIHIGSFDNVIPAIHEVRGRLVSVGGERGPIQNGAATD